MPQTSISNFAAFFKNNTYGMIFHENRLLADDSHEISYLIFFQKFGKMSQKMPSAAVVIGALRVKVNVPSIYNVLLVVDFTK